MTRATIKKPPESNHGNLDKAREKKLIKDILLLRLRKTSNGTNPNMVDQSSEMSIMTKATTKKPLEFNHGPPDKVKEIKTVKDIPSLKIHLKPLLK